MSGIAVAIGRAGRFNSGHIDTTKYIFTQLVSMVGRAKWFHFGVWHNSINLRQDAQGVLWLDKCPSLWIIFDYIIKSSSSDGQKLYELFL